MHTHMCIHTYTHQQPLCHTQFSHIPAASHLRSFGLVLVSVYEHMYIHVCIHTYTYQQPLCHTNICTYIYTYIHIPAAFMPCTIFAYSYSIALEILCLVLLTCDVWDFVVVHPLYVCMYVCVYMYIHVGYMYVYVCVYMYVCTAWYC